MLFVFECPTCKARIEADATASGRQAHCPQCANLVAVPESRVDCGATLGGFRLDRRLGKGGMGEVFLGTQLSVERQVAVKVLPPGFAADQEAVQRFLHEGRLAARLDHANIVTVHEAGVDNGHYYLAMAYVEGESLDRRLNREGALPERDALTIVRTVAEALAYAWDEFQLLHRDLKPANIMLDRRGRVFLMDLGLAKSLGEESGMTVSGAILGTPHYMSPEQAMGSTHLSVQTDIYALGATLYHLVVGAPPFTGDSALKVLNQHVHEPLPPPRLRNPQVSEACSQVIAAMMAKQPGQRYPGWRELIADLDRVLAGTAPLPPAVRSGPAGTAVVSAAVSKAALTHQAQAALVRQHQAETSAKAPAAGRPPPAPAWRSPWALGLAAGAVVVTVLLVALALHVRGGAAAPPAARARQTSQTRQADTAQPAPPAKPSAASVAPPPAPVPPVPATAAAPAPAAARPAWERITLPHTGDGVLEFDGKDDEVRVPGLTWAESEPLTIEAAFSPARSGPDPAFVVGRSAGAGAMWLGIRDQRISARRRLSDGGLLTAAAGPLARDGAVHAAATWDGNVLQLYANGMLAATADPAARTDTQPAVPDEAFVVGSHAGSFFKGCVEAVRVSRGVRYTKGFDLEEALPLKPDKETLCLLDFEEGTGDVAKDSSGHGHDGQIKGALWRRQWPCPVPEETLRQVEEALRQANPGARDLALAVAGLPGGIVADLRGNPGLQDISGLSGLPILRLDLSNTSVADLSPLRGIPLGWLEINRWSGFTATNDGVTDLSPLAGAPLAGFCAYGQQHLEDISPLRGCPLRQLYLAGTGVSDLSPVVGAPLAALFLGDRCSGSFGAVRGMPLRVLNVAGCSSLTDLGPIEDCTQLEVLFTPKGRPPVPASLTTKLTKLKQVNPADGDTLAKASREAILQAIRDEWQEGLASPVAPQTTVLLTLAKPILAGRAADALQRWREKGEELGQGLAEEQRQAVAAQLDALAGMERQILTSLRADLGKTLEIELAEEKITGEVREVTADGIKVMQTVKQGQGTARLARTIRLTQLGIAERLRRLGPGDTAELNLQRGLLALEAARPDTARKLFEKAGGPLGDALAAELRTRQADARENAAEQAVVELLRQVSTAAKLEGKDKVVAAIRKRCGDDLKRVQAARKELAGFEKDYGETAAGKEWAPVVRRGLTYPIAGDVVLRVPDLGLELVPIAAGEFMMGSNTPGASACQPVHRARLSRPLWMGKYEVTQAEFEAVTGRNPSRFRGPRMPVETLAWDDTTAFCRELTRMEQAAGWLPDGFEFRLPTEAEWEYACRAGDNGESAADLSQVAWFSGNSGGQGHEVGQKKANPWGLYDLYGNVWERCLDYSAAGYYASSPAVDPVCLGPATACRVCRGGGYADDAATVTAWYRRLTWAQSAAIAELGFRVVLAAPLPATAP